MLALLASGREVAWDRCRLMPTPFESTHRPPLDPLLASRLKGCAWCGKLMAGPFEDYTCGEGHCTGRSRYHRECLREHEIAMGHVREGAA